MELFKIFCLITFYYAVINIHKNNKVDVGNKTNQILKKQKVINTKHIIREITFVQI